MIGEVTSWLLCRADDADTRQQQLLDDVRGHCAQLDRLAEHVTGFAKMMTKRPGEQQLVGWLERFQANDQPELHTFAAEIRHDLAAVTADCARPTVLASPKATSTSSKQQTTDVRPRQSRPSRHTSHLSLT